MSGNIDSSYYHRTQMNFALPAVDDVKDEIESYEPIETLENLLIRGINPTTNYLNAMIKRDLGILDASDLPTPDVDYAWYRLKEMNGIDSFNLIPFLGQSHIREGLFGFLLMDKAPRELTELLIRMVSFQPVQVRLILYPHLLSVMEEPSTAKGIQECQLMLERESNNDLNGPVMELLIDLLDTPPYSLKHICTPFDLILMNYNLYLKLQDRLFVRPIDVSVVVQMGDQSKAGILLNQLFTPTNRALAYPIDLSGSYSVKAMLKLLQDDMTGLYRYVVRHINKLDYIALLDVDNPTGKAKYYLDEGENDLWSFFRSKLPF